jgi:folate-binding protein YgfZ
VTVLDPIAGYRALRHEVAVVRTARDVLLAVGGDAVLFLQGQLSQDVAALGNGTSAWSFVLQPDGKVVALVRVTRLGEGVMALDMETGLAELVRARLTRFLLRVDCRIDGPVPDLEAVAVRGPRASGVTLATEGLLLRASCSWPGVEGVDVLAARIEVPDDLPEAPVSALEALRIDVGWPASGRDLTDTTLPAETGRPVLDRAVSFTKGCYAGQELVERMDARGSQAPHPLRVLDFGGEVAPAPGSEVLDIAGQVVGAVTSAATIPGEVRSVALAPVARRVEPGAAVQVVLDGGVVVDGSVRD